jgi:hypothetical protein
VVTQTARGKLACRDISLLLIISLAVKITRNKQFVAKGCKASSAMDAVTIQSGVTWKQAYEWTEAHNVTLVGSACSPIGAAGGFAQGGGHGSLTNLYGLGVDRILEYKVSLQPEEHLHLTSYSIQISSLHQTAN